ncbi:MAG: glycerophosphodiester phosphodiesterase family protein [Gemmataceae bacterium]
MPQFVDLQGHRGARGLKPENTLPAFEVALDWMVTTLELDLHLTKDQVPVVTHDAQLSPTIYRQRPNTNGPRVATRPMVAALTLEQLRGYLADRNPSRRLYPNQDNTPTPVAQAYARQHNIEPYTIPTLADVFAFVAAYAGNAGERANKTEPQRQRAREVRFNIELKRTPSRPQDIGDDFDGTGPSTFERQTVRVIQQVNAVERTCIQSFDHRAVKAARQLSEGLRGAALVGGMAPGSIPELVEAARAHVYSPHYRSLDQQQVRQAQRQNIQVIPWTVNYIEDMRRLLEWHVDGIITDFPDRLANLLHGQHIEF